jgi:hypothetical protein
MKKIGLLFVNKRNIPPILVLALCLFSILATAQVQAAPVFANSTFAAVWIYSDQPVDTGFPNVNRGYTWGPTSLDSRQDPYKESAGGMRPVQYFDKARMELTFPPLNEFDTSTVTNGLLTVELALGRRQEGDNTFVQLSPSQVQVAGDSNANGKNAVAPVYATFTTEVKAINQIIFPNRNGQVVTIAINRAGQTSQFNPPVVTHYSYYDSTTHHNVPDIFYNFINQKGPVIIPARGGPPVTGFVYTDRPLIFVFGLPITEAYWTRTEVAGNETDVLVQLFERRVLTYTPINPHPYKVEMGNTGQHYHLWRYGY